MEFSEIIKAKIKEKISFKDDVKIESGENSMSNTTSGEDDPPIYYNPTSSNVNPDCYQEVAGQSFNRLLQGPVVTMRQSEIGEGCYDITLMDGTTGTIVNANPDSVPDIPSNLPPKTPVNLPEAPPPLPPLPTLPTLPPLPPPPTLPKMAVDSQCTKAKDPKEKVTMPVVTNKVSSTAASAARPGSRHHLIDIYGLAIFLRQSTRCLSCKAADCLYVTGAISAQLSAITKVKISCQKCNYTASQALLRPNASSENAVIPQIGSSSNTPLSTPPSKTPSPHQSTPPLEAYRPIDPSFHSHDKNLRTVNDMPRARRATRSPKEKPPIQFPSLPTMLPTMPFPLGDPLMLGEEAWNKERTSLTENDPKGSPSISTSYGKCPKISSDLDYPKAIPDLDLKSKDMLWVKNEASKSPDSILPDIPIQSGRTSLDNLCEDTMCCPNKIENTLCPVTGILHQLSSNLVKLPELSINTHLQDMPQNTSLETSGELGQNLQRLFESDIKESETTKTSYLTELLQTNMHKQTSPSVSPCSTSSSSSSCSSIYTSCSTSQSCFGLGISESTSQPAPSLLQLLANNTMTSSFPFTSQMYPGMQAVDCQQSSTVDTTPAIPQKRKHPQNVEEALQIIRNLILNTDKPPMYKNPPHTQELKNATKKAPANDKKSDIADKDVPIDSDQSILSKEETQIHFGKFLNDKYLEYLQERAEANLHCLDKSQKKGDKATKKRKLKENPSKRKLRKSCHCRNNSADGSAKNDGPDVFNENPARDSKETENYPDNPSASYKEEDVETTNKTRSESSTLHNNSYQNHANKTCDAQSSVHQKASLKFRERRLKDRYSSKQRQRRIKIRDAGRCCHSTQLCKKLLKNQQNKLCLSSKAHGDRPSNTNDKSMCKQKRERGAYENAEILNYLFEEYSLMGPRPMSKGDQENCMGTSNDKPFKESRQKVDDEVDYGNRSDYINHRKKHNHTSDHFTDKEMLDLKNSDNPFSGDDSDDNFKKVSSGQEVSPKLGGFHDLLSSEIDSDSEEGKLTIDLKTEKKLTGTVDDKD